MFSSETKAAIANGDFRVSHIQLACYAATPTVPFLKLLKTMFGTLSETEHDVPDLAECMRLEFHSKSRKRKKGNKRTSRLTSVLLIKRQGGDIAWSVDFYDKRARVGQMKQGGTLNANDSILIDTHVRIDVTAQYRAILQIINASRSFLKKHGALFAQLPDAKFADEFLALEVTPTLRQLEFAVFVLSHREVGGRLIRGSFAGWLIPMVLDKIIPLRRVVAFTTSGLRAMEKSQEPVAVAWRAAKNLDIRNWARTLSLATKFNKTKIYEDRKRFWELNKIDISIPYAFYHRFQVHPSITLMTEEEREALVRARDQNNGDAIVRVLKAADSKLFTQMKAVVAEPILTPPVRLASKVLGEVEPALGEPAKAIEQGDDVAETPRVPFKRNWRRTYRPSWMPVGIDSRSSFIALDKAINETRRQRAASSSASERNRLEKRLYWIVEQRKKKKDSIERAKRTRRARKWDRPRRNRFPVALNKPQPTKEE